MPSLAVQTAYLAWICQSCLFMHAYDQTDPSLSPEANRALMTGFEPTDEITVGMLHADHSPYCERWAYGECECGVIEYMKRDCDGCGSPYAGTRHAVTVWTTDPADTELPSCDGSAETCECSLGR